MKEEKRATLNYYITLQSKPKKNFFVGNLILGQFKRKRPQLTRKLMTPNNLQRSEQTTRDRCSVL